MHLLATSLVVVSVVALSVSAAADAAEGKLSFLAVGDWGGIPFWPYHSPGQKETAQGMGKVASAIKSEYVIALGDNFYFSGITDAHSKRFKDTFQKVYDAESLKTPWYAIAGNHDHKGNVSAQIEYTSVDDTGRWQFPELYHAHSFSSSTEGVPQAEQVTVDLILLDTVDLCSMNELTDESEEGYFDKLPLRAKSEAAEQWAWLEARMAASTADYLLVGGHFPVYSVCSHGNTDTLVQHLKPLLQQYGAHYLSGHDHCMVHVQEPDSPVNYILSGMGDFCCYNADKKEEVAAEALKWSLSKENHGHIFDHDITGGFTSFQATKSALTIQYHDQKGHVLFTADPVAVREGAAK